MDGGYPYNGIISINFGIEARRFALSECAFIGHSAVQSQKVFNCKCLIKIAQSTGHTHTHAHRDKHA